MEAEPGGNRASVRHRARALLTGTAQPCAADAIVMRRAALTHPTDSTLHAAAALSAFTVGGPIDDANGKGAASADRGWITGLFDLIDYGHVDAAAYAAKLLASRYADAPFIELMALVGESLPAAVTAGRQPFSDAPDRDVQVVATPGATCAIVAFCGARGNLALPLAIMDRWLAQSGAHVIYVRDPARVGYLAGIPALGSDMSQTAKALRTLTQDLGAHQVACLGNSSGASGALRYAPQLGAARVLALAPITAGWRFERRLREIGAASPEAARYLDIATLYRRNTSVEVRVMYGADNEADRHHALRMAGLPLVSVEPIIGWSTHHLVSALLHEGRLTHELAWLTDHHGQVARDDRDRRARRDSNP